jgi:hypothetical protein
MTVSSMDYPAHGAFTQDGVSKTTYIAIALYDGIDSKLPVVPCAPNSEPGSWHLPHPPGKIGAISTTKRKQSASHMRISTQFLQAVRPPTSNLWHLEIPTPVQGPEDWAWCLDGSG